MYVFSESHMFPVIGEPTQLLHNLHHHDLIEAHPAWRVETNPFLFVKGLLLI